MRLTANNISVSYSESGQQLITLSLTTKFESFQKWSSENGYAENLTIDRKNNDKGYSPDNCKWSTMKEQNRNKRANRIIELNGEKQCMVYWSEKLNIPMSTIVNRLNRGCTPEQALKVSCL